MAIPFVDIYVRMKSNYLFIVLQVFSMRENIARHKLFGEVVNI